VQKIIYRSSYWSAIESNCILKRVTYVRQKNIKKKKNEKCRTGIENFTFISFIVNHYFERARARVCVCVCVCSKSATNFKSIKRSMIKQLY